MLPPAHSTSSSGQRSQTCTLSPLSVGGGGGGGVGWTRANTCVYNVKGDSNITHSMCDTAHRHTQTHISVFVGTRFPPTSPVVTEFTPPFRRVVALCSGCDVVRVQQFTLGCSLLVTTCFSLPLQDQTREHCGAGRHLRESGPPLPGHAAVSSTSPSARFRKPQGRDATPLWCA